ncbi:MAG: flagella basal body P-ring formation protein FlgA [Elusimicrobiales bacterium]
MKRDIKPGEVIDMGMFDVYYSSGCKFSFNENESISASRYIRKGEIAYSAMFKKTPILKTGEKIKAYIKTDGVSIGIRVTVLNDAGWGEEVKLFDRNSSKIYKTLVYDKNKIIIKAEGI